MLKNSYNRLKVLQIVNKETNKYPQNNLLKYNRLLKGSKLLITLLKSLKKISSTKVFFWFRFVI